MANMSSENFAAHPLAGIYAEKAEQAVLERYDGSITDEQRRELAATFMISVDESMELARAAEHIQRHKEIQ